VDNFVDKTHFSVDNSVDNLCLTFYFQVIHKLSTDNAELCTGLSTGKTQVKELILKVNFKVIHKKTAP